MGASKLGVIPQAMWYHIGCCECVRSEHPSVTQLRRGANIRLRPSSFRSRLKFELLVKLQSSAQDLFRAYGVGHGKCNESVWLAPYGLLAEVGCHVVQIGFFAQTHMSVIWFRSQLLLYHIFQFMLCCIIIYRSTVCYVKVS